MLRRIEHGPVLELRLDRPPANALSPELIEALRDAVAAASASVSRGRAGALVLSGAEGMFSAGLDVPRFLTLDRAGVRAAWSAFYELMELMAASPIPIAAAVTGHAPAGGCVLALFSDWRVMASGEFKIGLNEVRVGLPMPPPIQAAATHVLGLRRAETICTTAELFPAGRALELGLVDELAPPGKVVEQALAWLRRLLELPPLALRKTRAQARGALIEACRRSHAALDEVVDAWLSEETQGALKALVERLSAKAP